MLASTWQTSVDIGSGSAVLGAASTTPWGTLLGWGRFLAAMPRLPYLQEYLEFRKERSQMLLSRRNQLLLEFSFWNEPQPRAGPNIYELRTYKLKVLPSLQIPVCLPPSLLQYCLTDTLRWAGLVPQQLEWGFWPFPPSGLRTEVCVHMCIHPGASQGP